jgi:tetratricopeptide (TPR) repeat protein
MNEREQAHHEAIGAWVAGDWVGAGAALDGLLQRWPADLLALQLGHQLDFFVGDAANLRDRPGRTLPALDPQHPHTAFVRGMQAFGLEESGDYGAAEAAGLRAVETNPDDVWAVHAVVHVREMQGQVDEGIRFLVDREADWGSGNLFKVHNWWHLALFLLEVGEIDRILDIYDAELHNAKSEGVPLEMLDASALLWRLLLDGHDTGERFGALADAWATRLMPASWYVFNNLHGVMALVGAGRLADAEHHIEELAGYVHRDGAGTNVRMASTIGLPACRAVLRFGQGRYDEAVDELVPIRRTFQMFGGSHAQRDALVRTLLESALRAGQLDLARALIAERLSLRPTSVYGWTQQARLQQALGDRDSEGAARQEATDLRHRFEVAG